MSRGSSTSGTSSSNFKQMMVSILPCTMKSENKSIFGGVSQLSQVIAKLIDLFCVIAFSGRHLNSLRYNYCKAVSYVHHINPRLLGKALLLLFSHAKVQGSLTFRAGMQSDECLQGFEPIISEMKSELFRHYNFKQ